MHRSAICSAVLLTIMLGCSGAPRAHDATPDAAPDASHTGDTQALLAIIDAIEKGWEQGDAAPFERHFLDFEGARYVESGGQNEGLRDLVDHHVVPEKDALAGLLLDFDKVETHVEGDFAWAVADVEVRAEIRADGRTIHKRGYETFLFRRVAGVWKVVHTHSSTRSVAPVPSDGHEHG